MRSIGLACAVVALAAGTLVSVPARAGEPDWKTASAAYAKARDAAKKSKAQPDFALCAGNWAAWDDAIYDGKVTDQAQATLDADLRVDSADEKVNLWRLWLGDDSKTFDIFDQHRENARGQIDRAMGGDVAALAGIMGTLGACQLPKDR
jgi:hypothetical protein